MRAYVLLAQDPNTLTWEEVSRVTATTPRVTLKEALEILNEAILSHPGWYLKWEVDAT